jgi:hypothetical protein
MRLGTWVSVASLQNFEVHKRNHGSMAKFISNLDCTRRKHSCGTPVEGTVGVLQYHSGFRVGLTTPTARKRITVAEYSAGASTS